MKQLLLSLIAITLCIGSVSAQKVRPSEYASYVNLVKESKGSVTLRSNGWGKTEAQAVEDAEVRAILTLLYVGLPSAQRLSALVPNEQEANDKKPDYFERLVTQRAYKRFVTESSPKGSFTKLKGEKQKSMPVDITVNVDALRKDLQANDVIRKFGF